jgi:hypothetical protein
MTGCQRRRSACMKAAKASGEPPATSHPAASILGRACGEFRMALISWFSRAIASRGVPAGATKPFHATASKPAKPLSAIVGRSFICGQRLGPVTASGRMRPAWISGSSEVGFDMIICTSPAAAACTAGGAPLNGMCTTYRPPMCLSSSIARCEALPLPTEA